MGVTFSPDVRDDPWPIRGAGLPRTVGGGRRRLLAASALVAVIAAACASGGGGPEGPTAAATPPEVSAPGVTDDTIRISVVAGFDGPFGEVVEAIYTSGLETWAEDVNAAGGIRGRRVELVKVGHGETPDGGVAACKEVLSNDTYLAILVQGQVAQSAAADCLDEAGFTNLVWGSSDSFIRTWTHSYTMFPSDEEQGRLLAKYLRATFGTGEKLGILQLNIPVYLRVSAAFQEQAQFEGLQVVGVQTVEAGQTSFKPQLLRLQEAGTTTLVMLLTNEAIGIAGDLAQMPDFRPTLTGSLWQFDFIPQAAPGAFDGAQALRLSAPVDVPAFAAFQQKAERFGNSGALDGEGFLYYGYGLLLQRVLEGAGEDPTTASLVDSIQSVQDFETGILAPITWGPGDQVGADAMFPTRCCGEGDTWMGDGAPASDF